VKLSRKLLWLAVVLVALLVVTGAAFWARPISFFNAYTYVSLRLDGVESETVTVAGHRIHYYAEGPSDGPVVVLVHGLGGRSEDWRNLAPYFARYGFRVYLPDLPGYGSSEQPVNFSYSVPDEAAVVVGFFDALGVKQADLGGWSMGGWIVQRIASEHPERVRKLILFDSAGLYEEPAWDTRLFTPSTPAELDQLDALLMPNPPKVPGFIAEDILRLSRKNAWVIHRALGTMLTGKDATDTLLPGLKMPVLIVWGEEDRITPLRQGKKMSMLIPQSQLAIYRGCGHLAPTQCSEGIGPEVVEFANQ
jgi:pimeloyl-ACP methyl ester carboxylesterase